MSADEKKITRDDILDTESFEKIRKDKLAELLPRKRNRRVEVGPDATFYFENYDTMWLQVHEMLRIEKGGEEQIADELDAYNPLIPQGRDLVATVMFEINDKQRREELLGKLGGVEDCFVLKIGDEEITAEYETDVERSTEEGRASSVHFIHFNLTDGQARSFKDGSAPVELAIDHPHYRHATKIGEDVRRELAGDLD